MKEKIAITGSNGIIGTVLKEGLSSDYDITEIDLPKTDVKDYKKFLEAIRNHFAIIHLAWDPKIEHSKSNEIDSENSTMYRNVYRAAAEAKVQRVIMASSIHADNFYGWKGPGLMLTYQKPNPLSLYGKDKVSMEREGRDFAAKGFEVVCVRFGGINPANKAPSRDLPRDMATWLSKKDCVALIRSILKTPKVPNNFAIVYGVSNNAGRISDVSNPFGWIPEDRAQDF
jgi:nucleoside-diphosphate-sugar epimerase